MRDDLTSNDAIRIRRQYRGDNLYVICSYDESGRLSDIDLSQSVGGAENACTTSGLEFVAKLVSVLVREGRAAEVIEMATAASLGGRTLPGIVAAVLRDHGQLPEVEK